MDNTNQDHVPDGQEEHIDAIAERPTTHAKRTGSHADWLRSQSDEQLRLQVLSRHT
jgi:hypothetical protein